MDAQIEKVIAETVKEFGEEQAAPAIRAAVQRVLEIARKTSCAWCAAEFPIIRHNDEDWHPSIPTGTRPFNPCGSEAVRSLADGPQKKKGGAT